MTSVIILTDNNVGHCSTNDVASPNTDIVVTIRSQLCSREGNIVYAQLSIPQKPLSSIIKVKKGYLDTAHWSRLLYNMRKHIVTLHGARGICMCIPWLEGKEVSSYHYEDR